MRSGMHMLHMHDDRANSNTYDISRGVGGGGVFCR